MIITEEFKHLMDELIFAHQANNGSLNLTAYGLEKGYYGEDEYWDKLCNVQNYLQDAGLLRILNDNRYSELTQTGIEYNTAAEYFKEKERAKKAEISSHKTSNTEVYWRWINLLIALAALVLALFKK